MSDHKVLEAIKRLEGEAKSHRNAQKRHERMVIDAGDAGPDEDLEDAIEFCKTTADQYDLILATVTAQNALLREFVEHAESAAYFQGRYVWPNETYAARAHALLLPLVPVPKKEQEDV